MKRFLIILLCVILLCALTVSAFAEDSDVGVPPEEPAEKSEAQIEAELMTDQIVSWVQYHLEEISVIITLILTVFYQVRKHASLNKSIRALNNNAVAVAENSGTAIDKALSGVSGVSAVVTEYINKMDNLLTEVRANAEEKKKLTETLAATEKYFASAKAANIELANELAELLCLSNIPNAKKEELYSRHRAAVDAISAIENTEVKHNEATKE